MPARCCGPAARARIGSGVTGPGAALWVEVEPVEETVSDHARELAEDYKRVVVAVLQRRKAWQVIDTVQRVTDPSAIADMAGYAPYLSDEQKRELLETPDVEQRLETVIAWTRDHFAEAEVTDKISDDVREGMEKSQREFLLREQLAAIRKELGEGEPEGADDYRARVEAAEVPEKVREAALREVDKLERSSDQNPEAGWIRTWLDTVLELPWAVTHRGLQRRRRCPRGPGRRPPRSRRRQGPDRGVPRRPLPPRRARPGGRSAAGAPARCSCWSALPASARPRWASPWPAPWAASSSGSPSAASATRPRSVATGARTSARCPAASSAPSRRPAR